MKKILLTLVAIAMLVSCSTEQERNNLPVEIKFTSNITQNQSRVSGTDANLLVGIYMIKANPGTLAAENILEDNKPYKALADEITSIVPADGIPLLYPDDNSSVKFISYYPYNTSVGSDYKLPINVSNQSNQSAIDVLYSSVTTASYDRSSSIVPLWFDRKLVKLVFYISNSESVTEPVANGITVAVSNQKTEGTLNLADGTVIASGATTTITASGGAIVEMIVFPTTSTSGVEFTLTNNAGQSFTVAAPSGDWQSGSKYAFYVTLKSADSSDSSDVDIMSIITPWLLGGNYDITGNENEEMVSGAITMTTSKSSVTLGLDSSGPITIFWGDGSSNTYPSISSPIYGGGFITHTYPDSSPRTIKITGDNITSLSCSNNELTSLNVSECTTLVGLICANNMLTELDLSENSELMFLNCANNKLSALNVSGCPQLIAINCRVNLMDATGLNALFGTLPIYPANSGGLVIIGGNSGASDCNRDIAVGRGWGVND
jgi:hypothetical protein